MNIDDVHCELLTTANINLMNAALDNLTELDELKIDKTRLKNFLEHPQNFAFIAKYHDEVCGFIYGYLLLSLTTAPQ